MSRLTESAAMIEREIEADLDKWETMIGAPEGLGGLPPGGTLIVFSREGVIKVRGERPAYYPLAVPAEVPPDERLLRAKDAEFTRKDLDAAIAAYREAAMSTGRTVRATATAGLGRCLRAQGKMADALAVYSELATMSEAVVDGVPAPVLAYHEREEIFVAMGDLTHGADEGDRLARYLAARDVIIEKPAFERFAEGLAPGRLPAEPLDRARALFEMWPRLRDMASGRAVARGGNSAYVAAWRAVDGDSHAVLAPVDVLMKRARDAADRLAVTIALEDATMATVWGPAPTNADHTSHSLDRIGLPVRLRLSFKEP